MTATAAAAVALGLALAPAASASATVNNIYGLVGDNSTTVYATQRWHNTGGASINLTFTPPCGGNLNIRWRNAQTAVTITQWASWASGTTGTRTMKNTAGGTSIAAQWFKMVANHTGQCWDPSDHYFQGTVTF